jgi:probable F420-dependent oxidoreductase
MRFGVSVFLTDISISPAEAAREAEARGFGALYMPEHTHIPTSRKTPAPMGEPLPVQYQRCLDPFVALTAAALATKKIRLGTAICLVAQRDPFVTAKEVATLDVVSNGRFVLGAGFGWNVEEIEDHGVPYRKRRAVGRENILAMKRLWEDEEASFQGEHVSFESSWAWPKPVQKPHPPVFLGGGAGPILFSHVAEYADGWMPIGAKGVAKTLPDLHAALEKTGRDPATIEVIPVGSTPDPGKLEYFAKIGVTETVFGLPHGTRDEVLPEMDRCLEAVREFQGVSA